MMRLNSAVSAREIREEPTRFDFLDGVVDYIQRGAELHPHKNADDNYIFVFWLKDVENADVVVRRIRRNVRQNPEANHDWAVRAWNANGLVIVNTWI